ncbi:Anaphase-promoting complex subunit 7 [Capsicum annuum]|nr:Anaphase-promoting complex subunit 7 [Capsicum annuum]
MDVPKDYMTTLLDHGLFASAQMLGCFLVSSSSISLETSPHLKAENLVLLGDALFREKEYRRAIHTYKQALHCHRLTPKQNASAVRSSLSASTRSSSPNSFNISTINENEVKFKIASSHCALNENRAALLEMEGVPSKARNLQMNLMMGKLYRNSRHTRAAITSYKECLRHCPCIIEAIIALAELGVAAKDIISLFPQTPTRGARSTFDHFDSSRWLQLALILTNSMLYLPPPTSNKYQVTMSTKARTDGKKSPSVRLHWEWNKSCKSGFKFQ